MKDRRRKCYLHVFEEHLTSRGHVEFELGEGSKSEIPASAFSPLHPSALSMAREGGG